MLTKPESKPDFSQIDDQVSDWWKENNIFEKTLERSEGKEEYIFYDGPPFMSGTPHYGTLLSSMPKDAIPRYQTMKGKHVERLWGWDTHGLPIENKVEEELGLSGRKQILEYGLEGFIEKCYEWNRIGIDNWRWYVDKLGRWADMDNAYRTMDQDYMESVWWVFGRMWEKGLIYKDMRTSLFSTDSSTPVSNFEVSMDPDNYQDTEDIAVTIKFRLKTKPAIPELRDLEDDLYLAAWTTTPWTLPSNFALAVNPEAEYIALKTEKGNIILAKERLEATLGDMEYEEIAVMDARKLEKLEYEQLYDFLPGGENDFKVYVTDYVTTDEGTGVLHIAPAFGEADFDMGKQWDLSFTSDIDDSGNMLVGPWEGTYIREANPLITEDLEKAGKLFKSEMYVHRLPFYRYENPLIYKVTEDYFVDIQSIKKQLKESNKQITWVPEHFKEGRFEYILDTAPDWSISRTRFWGTVMPIWQSDDEEQIIVSSRDQLMQLVNDGENDQRIQKVILQLGGEQGDLSQLEAFIGSEEDEFTLSAPQSVLSDARAKFLGETEQESNVNPIEEGEAHNYYLINSKPLNLHRPYIDDVEIVRGGKLFTRIPETLDVWMDSGSMPFAQFHYPFKNKEKFEQSFPGDFISEYTGQIRAWFYVMHVIANAVFDKPAFQNVLVSGVMRGTDGRKMSKSYKNYPDPRTTLEGYGGDALRLYFMGSPVMMGNDINFNEDDLKAQTRDFLLPLWNIYKYLATYGEIHEWTPRPELAYNDRTVWDDKHPWDHIPFDDIENEMDAWILVTLQNSIGKVTEAMDDYEIPKAIRALEDLITETSKWYIRRSRDRFVEGDIRALEVLYYVLVETIKMASPIIPFTTEHIYQQLVASQNPDALDSVHMTEFPVLDLNLLKEYSAITEEMATVRAISELGQTIRAEKGIKVRQPLALLEIEFAKTQDEKGAYLSPWMQRVLAAELNVAEVKDVPSLNKAESYAGIEDKAKGIKVALQTELTPELKSLGTVRELIRQLQALRKKTGMEMGERIIVTYSTDDPELLVLIEKNSEEIKDAVSADTLTKADSGQDLMINEVSINLGINRVE